MKLKNGMTQDRQRDVPRRTNFRLEGYWLHVVRGAWIGFVLVELIIIILSLFASHTSGLSICPTTYANCDITPATAQALHQLGIAPSSYLIYNFLLALLQVLVGLGVGGFIFWRRSREPLCLAVSLAFVNLGLSPFYSQSTYQPAVVFGFIAGLWSFLAIGYFLVAFPDGRFMPRWSWLLVVLWGVQAFFFEIPGPLNSASWPPALLITEELLTFGGTVGVFIYRYMRVFSYSQRQQTKWLIYGFTILLVLNILYDIIGSLVPELTAPNAPYQLAGEILVAITFLSLPLIVGFAILFSSLWDIDVIIRRTLVYFTLTMILVMLYVGIVFIFSTLLRNVFNQGQQNPLVIVASTLVIAALFQPLRRGIQRIIDRRFYRQKYDAAKTLEAFSATLRNEVDLNQLRENLLNVVQETMQPAHVSLWLRSSERHIEEPQQMEKPTTAEGGF